MENTNKTESIVADINKNVFFKEFTYSKNNFQSAAKDKELEFADNVVWIEDILFVIQIKDRNPENAQSAKKENNWFKNKVLTKGKKQIEDSIRFLNSSTNITIENERGYKFCISDAKGDNVRKIIIYSSSDKLSKVRRLQKYCMSDKVGYIHILNSTDYKWICKILFTPTEIDNYLVFREKIITKYSDNTKLLPEQAILGQFLSGNLDKNPNYNFVEYWKQLDVDQNEFSMQHIFDSFPNKIEFETYKNSYYNMFIEFAMLTRSELRMFKERFELALKLCGSTKSYPSTRFAIPHRKIGFIIIPVTLKKHYDSTEELRILSLAHKYDQKLDKCIGVSIAKDGSDTVILWEFLEKEWIYDQYWEDKLKEFSPLSEVKPLNNIQLYNFSENS